LKNLKEDLRYEQLKAILTQNCFKVICGAGNEDAEQVKRLSFVYTLAGASILDVSANIEVIKSATEGIDLAFEHAKENSMNIKVRPFIMASVGMSGDHHVRKASIDPLTCVSCALCAPVCPTEAIPYDFHLEDKIKSFINTEKEIVIKELCIGCGKCSNICPKDDIISFKHNEKILKELLPKCLDAGAECFELHASIAEDENTLKEWELLVKINPNNFNSLCLDRLNLGNLNLENRIDKINQISVDKLIIQADGYPMSGGQDDFNTTLQAVACADVINKKFNMKTNKRRNIKGEKSKIPSKMLYKQIKSKGIIPILLSGGTNSLSRQLADLTGVRINGVAIGTFARNLIEQEISQDEFFNNENLINSSINLAKELVRMNNLGDSFER